MIPILFESTETDFSTNGIGLLSECVSCEVVEERNEGYELEMEYPITGIRYSDISQRKIIYAKPSPSRNPQPFRIYKITKQSNGLLKIYAQHISYDLTGIPVTPFSASTAAAAINGLASHMTVENDFTFATNINKNGNFEFVVPSSARSLMGGHEGSLLDIFHGEWEYSGFRASLWAARGSNNGVKIEYGKNITTLEQESEINAVYTGVLPYYYSEADGLIQGQVQNVPSTFDFVRILPYDFSDKFEEPPTVAQLNAQAVTYIQESGIGIPTVSLKVSFADLSKASGYESIRYLESVELCDTITVRFPKLNISTSAKVVKTRYDTILERYKSIEIGTPKDGITKTIASQAAALKSTPTKSAMEKAVYLATQLITGAMGGYVIMHDSNGDKHPDEILIMDTDNIQTARNVWRWNKNGLGYSSNGYAGPYGLAMTIDGSIVADFITSGGMSADRITSGTIDADNINVQNINGENIKNQTIGNAAMGVGSIGSSNIIGGSVGTGALSADVNGTLLQVGNNAATIAQLGNTIYAIMQGSLSVTAISCNQLSTNYLYIGGTYFTMQAFYDYYKNVRYALMPANIG